MACRSKLPPPPKLLPPCPPACPPPATARPVAAHAGRTEFELVNLVAARSGFASLSSSLLRQQDAAAAQQQAGRSLFSQVGLLDGARCIVVAGCCHVAYVNCACAHACLHASCSSHGWPPCRLASIYACSGRQHRSRHNARNACKSADTRCCCLHSFLCSALGQVPLFHLARAAAGPAIETGLRVIRVAGDGRCMFRSASGACT